MQNCTCRISDRMNFKEIYVQIDFIECVEIRVEHFTLNVKIQQCRNDITHTIKQAGLRRTRDVRKVSNVCSYSEWNCRLYSKWIIENYKYHLRHVVRSDSRNTFVSKSASTIQDYSLWNNRVFPLCGCNDKKWLKEERVLNETERASSRAIADVHIRFDKEQRFALNEIPDKK